MLRFRIEVELALYHNTTLVQRIDHVLSIMGYTVLNHTRSVNHCVPRGNAHFGQQKQ